MDGESLSWAPEIPAGATKMVISYSTKKWESAAKEIGVSSESLVDFKLDFYRNLTEGTEPEVESREVAGGMEFVLTFENTGALQEEMDDDNSTFENEVFAMGGSIRYE